MSIVIPNTNCLSCGNVRLVNSHPCLVCGEMLDEKTQKLLCPRCGIFRQMRIQNNSLGKSIKLDSRCKYCGYEFPPA